MLRLAKEHGPIFRVWSGPLPIVVVSKAEHVEVSAPVTFMHVFSIIISDDFKPQQGDSEKFYVSIGRSLVGSGPFN